MKKKMKEGMLKRMKRKRKRNGKEIEKIYFKTAFALTLIALNVLSPANLAVNL